MPERIFPGAVRGFVDGLRIGKVRENPRRRFGNDTLAVVRHD
jgi:hypothetical protein